MPVMLMRFTRIAMQILMSDSLMNRVNTETPSGEKLLASFILQEDLKELVFPVTFISWSGQEANQIGVGITDISLFKSLIDTTNKVDISVKDLNIYVENILNGRYIIKEHNNYIYELCINAFLPSESQSSEES